MTDTATAEESWQAPPPAAVELFGVRLALAVRYAELLTSVAVDRGLIGPRESSRIWSRHVVPGGRLGELIPSGAVVADVGSGAGLPGIPLAIARPDLDIRLVEPMLRRTTFLSEVARELELSVQVLRARAQDAPAEWADVVVARAVAPLDRLLPMVARLARPGGVILAVKGSSAHKEVALVSESMAADAARITVTSVGAGADASTVVQVRLGAEPVRSPQRPRRRRST